MGKVFSCACVCMYVGGCVSCYRAVRIDPSVGSRRVLGTAALPDSCVEVCSLCFSHPSLYRKSPSATPNPLLLTGTTADWWIWPWFGWHGGGGYGGGSPLQYPRHLIQPS